MNTKHFLLVTASVTTLALAGCMLHPGDEYPGYSNNACQTIIKSLNTGNHVPPGKRLTASQRDELIDRYRQYHCDQSD